MPADGQLSDDGVEASNAGGMPESEEHTAASRTPGTVSTGQLQLGAGTEATIAALLAQVQQLQASHDRLQAAVELRGLSDMPAAHPAAHSSVRGRQERTEITLPDSMTLRQAWCLYCCGNSEQQPLMNVIDDRSVVLLPASQSGYFRQVMRTIRQAVVGLEAWRDNPTPADSLAMLQRPELRVALLRPDVTLRRPLQETAWMTVRKHLRAPGSAPAASSASLSRTPGDGAAGQDHTNTTEAGDAHPSTDDSDDSTPAAKVRQRAKRKKATKKVTDATETAAGRRKISAAANAATPQTRPARGTKHDNGAATKAMDTALAAARGHSTRGRSQADVEATTTLASTAAREQETNSRPITTAAEKHVSVPAGGVGDTQSAAEDEEHETGDAAAVATTAAAAALTPATAQQPAHVRRGEKRKQATEVADATETAAQQRKTSAAATTASKDRSMRVQKPQQRVDGPASANKGAAAEQAVAAAPTTVNTTVSAHVPPAKDRRKRTAEVDTAESVSEPKRIRASASPTPALRPAQPTGDADAATPDDGTGTGTDDGAARQPPASGLGAADDTGGTGADAASASPVRKRRTDDEHEGAPAAKLARGAATLEDDSRTTTHCVLLSPASPYCALFVADINIYLHARFRRQLHVVPPDGDCAFHTVSFFSGIPHGVLRWTAAVATAIRIAAVARLHVMTDAARKVHALLEYYREDLAAEQKKKAARKARQAKSAKKSKRRDVVAAAASVAAARPEDVQREAITRILKPKEWVESSVLILMCEVLQLRMAVLTVADEHDSTKWFLLSLFDTLADDVVDDSVRLAVFFSQHYSPCMLEVPVDAAQVPACLDFPRVVHALCAEVSALPAFQWPPHVPGAVDIQVRVWCVVQ